MMKRGVIALLVLSLALSGCGDKPKPMSQAEMEAQAPVALARFSDAIGPAGDLAHVDIEGWVNVEVQTQFGPIKSQLNTDAQIHVGPGATVLVAGSLSNIRFTGYCDADRVVVITDGLSNYGEEDQDLEYRNLEHVCTGRDAKPLLTSVADFDLVDPAILTGDLDPEVLTFAGVELVKGDRFLATYINQGLTGNTSLTIEIDDGLVQRVTSDNEDSHLVMTMTYGPREVIPKPEAAERSPTATYGFTDVTDDGWEWRGSFREGAPVEEMELHIFEAGTEVGCHDAPEPIATFDLGGVADQRDNGFQMLFFEDGDGALGPGDSIQVRHPGSLGDAWDYEARFYDSWAQAYAASSCDIPAAGWSIGILAIFGAVLLRRR